jgi:hypothetical protein
MSNTRYYVYSKNSKTQKPLKNAATREAAREYKRAQNTPSNYGIYDRVTGEHIH